MSPIPKQGQHRGVGLHIFQDEARLAVVRQAIDHVFTLNEAKALFDFAGDPFQPPEARLFAAARCEALFELATEGREARPAVDMLRLRAFVVGLDDLRSIHPRLYGSFKHPQAPPGVKYPARPVPLTDEQTGRDPRR
jgi:hypothetical protein